MNYIGKKHHKAIFKRLLSIFLVVSIVVTSLNLESIISNAATNVGTGTGSGTTNIYLIDNTAEKWLDNDNAVLELVDNSNGHDYYEMTKISESMWQATVPSSATNITFNRLSPNGQTQWNSFSAGGRGTNNAYYADGAEYGHWEYYEREEGKEENYFHFGDIICLDISEFTDWKKDGATLYVNFSDVSKESNGGKDISINGNVTNINPKIVSYEVNENIYAYAVNEDDIGKDILRFWRGNDTTLWNCSITLSYEEYKEGKNSIKIKGWNEASISSECQNGFDMKDNDDDGLPNFYEDLIHADKNISDSDGDGLSDGYELFTTLTNPTKIDTDDNGVDDGDEDFDEDKLSTLYEYELGINPKDNDTDGDGLGDYSELKYNMNPNDQDTLDDGVIDGNRVFDVVCEGDISDNEDIIPHLSIELYGKQVDSLSITKIDEDDNS